MAERCASHQTAPDDTTAVRPKTSTTRPLRRSPSLFTRRNAVVAPMPTLPPLLLPSLPSTLSSLVLLVLVLVLLVLVLVLLVLLLLVSTDGEEEEADNGEGAAKNPPRALFLAAARKRARSTAASIRSVSQAVWAPPPRTTPGKTSSLLHNSRTRNMLSPL